ncbi:MAG: hypothetical protein AAF639_45145 [Chloroflexota bacterium]
MSKQTIVRFMLALALVFALGGGFDVAADALGFSTGPAVYAGSPIGTGGGCC